MIIFVWLINFFWAGSKCKHHIYCTSLSVSCRKYGFTRIWCFTRNSVSTLVHVNLKYRRVYAFFFFLFLFWFFFSKDFYFNSIFHLNQSISRCSMTRRLCDRLGIRSKTLWTFELNHERLKIKKEHLKDRESFIES